MAASVRAQGTISGLTSTPITFSGHADAFVAGPDGNVWLLDSTANAVGRLAVDGTAYQAFTVPTPSAGLQSITAGPDGNLWFTESFTSKVGRITTSGAFTEFAVPGSFHFAYPVLVATGSIFPGPDGNLWISGQNQMARVTPQGTVTVVTVPPPQGVFSLSIGKCVVGSDNNFWCQSAGNDTIDHTAKLTTSGAVTLYPGQGQSFDFVRGPDGNVWYVSQGTPPESLTRITPAGVETIYTLPTHSLVEGLAVGADGNLWFTERATMGNIWQMILSSATDDGHATFNSAPISLGYPEGIIAVTSPTTHATGIHTEQTTATCPKYAFVLGSSASYGANLSWVQIASPPTCTDLKAASIKERYFTGGRGMWSFCYCKPNSPYDAMNPRMDVQFPLFTEVTKATSFFGTATCSITSPAGKGPLVTCTRSTPLIVTETWPVLIDFEFLGLNPAEIKCSSSTPEISPDDNQAKYYDLEFLGGPSPPPPPVDIRTRW